MNPQVTPDFYIHTGGLSGGGGMAALQEISGLASVQEHLHRLVRHSSHLWADQCRHHGSLHIRCSVSFSWRTETNSLWSICSVNDVYNIIQCHLKVSHRNLSMNHLKPLFKYPVIVCITIMYICIKALCIKNPIFQVWLKKKTVILLCIFGCNKTRSCLIWF